MGKLIERGNKGRPKGALNKTTALLKEAILRAAEQAGDDITPGGGIVAYLRSQAAATPGPFMGLLGKVLPQEMKAEVTGPNGRDLFSPDQVLRMAEEIKSKGKKE